MRKVENSAVMAPITAKLFAALRPKTSLNRKIHNEAKRTPTKLKKLAAAIA